MPAGPDVVVLPDGVGMPCKEMRPVEQDPLDETVDPISSTGQTEVPDAPGWIVGSQEMVLWGAAGALLVAALFVALLRER